MLFNGCICPYDYNTEQIICGSLKQLFIEKLEKQYGIKDAIFAINDDNDYIENKRYYTIFLLFFYT